MMYTKCLRHTAGDKIIELHGIQLDNTYGSVQQVQFLHAILLQTNLLKFLAKFL